MAPETTRDVWVGIICILVGVGLIDTATYLIGWDILVKVVITELITGGCCAILVGLAALDLLP